jgi:hypothetical protein
MFHSFDLFPERKSWSNTDRQTLSPCLTLLGLTDRQTDRQTDNLTNIIGWFGIAWSNPHPPFNVSGAILTYLSYYNYFVCWSQYRNTWRGSVGPGKKRGEREKGRSNSSSSSSNCLTSSIVGWRTLQRISTSRAASQTDSQFDRQIVRQAGRQTGRQTDRQTNRQTDGQAGRQAQQVPSASVSLGKDIIIIVIRIIILIILIKIIRTIIKS